MKTLMKTRPNGTFTSLVLGFAVAASAIAEELKVPGVYPTIQAAVNAALTNDIIRIASGVYTEQVRITSKRLTLIGQPGTILRATEQMSPFISPFPGITYVGVQVMLIELSDVTVRGLTFEGERLAEHFVGEGALTGLYFLRSSGDVENCAFYGFRESVPGPEDADCLAFQTFEDDDVTVRAVGCTFADSYEGIFLRGGPTRQNINATIQNNTIIGLGPLANDVNHGGINISQGVGGRIVGNTISSFSYTGTVSQFPISFGILASHQKTENPPTFGILQPLIFEGNTLRDNQMHIALVKGNESIVRNNRFQGTAPGIIPLGLSASGTNVTIANNQFEDMPEGIRLLGEHPLQDPLPNFGDILGFAINAQVTSNRFCNVTTPINRQSPATATETGTLTNSCSSPPLAIAPAVLVSWPAETNLWTVESATSVVGPWTPADATPFTQYGRHSIAVPTDGAHRFFRLR
jgi:nitrous oxidase accessory protein NosD